MAIKLPSDGLEGLGDISVRGPGAASFVPSGGSHSRGGVAPAPTWGVDDRIAASMAGMTQALERFAEVHDDVKTTVS